jgi:Mg-chelatase subunit ChlD
MSQNCLKCQAPNPPNGRFCQVCGATLGATSVQGRTVVCSPPPAPVQMSAAQIKTIVSHATAAYGTGPMATMPGGTGASLKNQREHTVFVVDVSGSMEMAYHGGMTKLDGAKRANVSMVLNKGQIDPNDEIGLVSFEDFACRILNLCPIRSHKTQILQAIQSLNIGGGTDINEGLKSARDTFDWGKNGVVRRIVLLTDGQGGDPLATAEDLKSRGVVIDVIGVGEDPSGVDEKLLRKVASCIQGEVRYRFIKDQQTLVAHYTRLAGKTATGA